MTVDLIIRTLATIIIAYLLGSLNPAIMITKLKTGKDIRTMGSGNAGFTNVLRSVGKGPAIATIVFDYLKGIAAVTFILLLVLLVWYTYWMRSRITEVCITLFGAMYTGLMMSGIIVIRPALPEPWGGLLVFLLLLSIIQDQSRILSFGLLFP